MPAGNQPTLARLQKLMQSALLRQDGAAANPGPELFVNGSRRLTAARHLDIYRHSYVARLRECMKNQFSALAYALGEELFQMFADQYLDAYPSESYTLNELGRRFPHFLQETRPDAGSEERESWVDFIIQLADFEYTLSVIFDAHSDDEPRPADDDTPDEDLRLNPLLRLFHHPYPICRYYLDVTRKREPELPLAEDSYCAVTRNDYRLRLLEVKPAQYHFLRALGQENSVAKAKEQLVSSYGFDALRLDQAWGAWRKTFIEGGFLGCIAKIDSRRGKP
ncbi:MAG: DNA-binding domain-containing protein [Acidobacteriota bacterium]|nr:DNA-binding domain-containing protein [Acidobacteriota bacterium]